MATQTSYYNLTKPAGTENVNVGVLNANSDIIDTELHNESVRASANIADIYDATATYTVGDFCTYLGVLYKCTTDTASPAGAFDSTEWAQVNATDEAVSWSSMNVLGAKNLLHYPYYEDTETDRGITYTNNDDGTVTLSAGTPTTGSNHILVTHLEPHQPLEKNTKYILSSGYDGNEAYLRLQFYNNGSIVATFSTSSGVVAIDTTGYTFNALQIQIFVTSTLSNDITLYPMLRPASVKDSTYVPYAQTNKELTENKVDWVSNGVLGAKNLIPYPYYETTKTLNGITFTDNGDGTITVSGTASADAVFYVRHISGASDLMELLPNTRYICNGCPVGGGDSTYKLQVPISESDGSNRSWYNNFGNDGTFTTTDVKRFVGVRIVIYSGAVLPSSGIVFKPMIRLASVKDSTYAPYAMTNKNLTDIVKCNQTTAGTYTLQATVASNGAVTYEWVPTT